MLKTPTRRSVIENSPLYYPFGITRFRNILENLDCGIGFESGIKILFLGCGDLRSTLLATTHANAKNFLIHLNDSNPSILARDILILKILSDMSFNPNKEEDLSFLWDVWYNAEWLEVTKKRFLVILNDILAGRLPDNVFVPDAYQLERLKEVWSSWIALCSKEESELSLFMQKIKKERSTFIRKEYDCWIGGLRELARLSSTDLFTTAVDDIVEHLYLENFVGIEGLSKPVMQKNRDEVRRFFLSGSCRLQSGSSVVCVNPTMLNPTTLCWEVHFSISPFHGYLPLTKEELDTSSDDNLLIRSCQKILKNFVSSYRSHIGVVKINVHLEDFLEFCYASTDQFDVIDCCNLPDQIGLANVLNAATARLSDNPQSTLFTHSIKWEFLADTVKKYVEGSLCVPLSMIPTIYGLRVDNHVELGASSLVNLRRERTNHPVNLKWKKVPSFRNVSLAPSSSLDRCLDQLADKCFDIMFPRCMLGPLPGDKCGMLLYTSLTYDYVVSAMAQRVGGDRWLKENRRCEDWLSGLFDLSQRTTKAWKNGQPVLKLTAHTDKPFNTLRGTPVLRLILIPCTVFNNSMAFKDNFDLSGPGNHMIDNFQFEMKKNREGNETISVSFLLVPNHGLEKSHLAFLMDLADGYPVYIFKALKFFQTEAFLEPHPFAAKESAVQTPSMSPQMTVKNCMESEDQYLLRIDISCSDSVSGLTVTTNRRKPCESAHDVTVSLSQPNNIEPLSMTFPFPILVDEIRATLHRNDHFINLVLKKAVLEPWPHEFQVEHTKWDADKLKLWVEKEIKVENDNFGISRPSLAASCMNSSMVHLVCQFKFSQVQTPSLMEKTPLNLVRCIIREIFQRFTSRKAPRTNFVRICRMGSSAENPDWYLRVHKPIRTSPGGSPMLMISAFDSNLAKSLETRNAASKPKDNNFSRVFPVPKPEETMTVEIESKESLQLFRYVLRLNSLRILPITWQKYNLDLGEDSPWLATFLSPLYLDSPSMYEKVGESSESEDDEACRLM